ncbi:TetR family transcriptional regulator [Actinomadura sp. WMMA1423]|uniref:TetR family transcriptional regulator n=1 Tax=Actinomadura sp. WMMA1423 TaxID=2591108 RepID=UPI00197AC607|nr:TetR family transcriptional regulator [Actinomadura sp. WMMA1423]
MPETVLTSDGRVAGRRAKATRQRLLDRLTEMLATSPYRDITVIDVARRAGTSPATFYQYFADIEAAVLTIAADMAEAGKRLRPLVEDQPWTGKSGYETAQMLVDGFLEFWRDNEAVLRVVDLATIEGDDRFHALRVRMLNNVMTALAAVIAGAQRRGRVAENVNPEALAGALVGMLAHNAAHQQGYESWEISVADLRESMAQLVFWAVSGRRPPK